MNNKEITTIWCRLIIEELGRHRIDRFCISPGSRSTPLTAAAARNPGTRCTIFPDERAAAFFALGFARATGKPAVLICTSGTAVANYFPAVVEASFSNLPILVLSADRPFELLETGANQTIRQQGLFGSYSRWNMELPEPSEAIPAEALLSTIDHAVRRTLGSPPGPVHLNLPFREPFEPVYLSEETPWERSLTRWKQNNEPLNSFSLNMKIADRKVIDHTKTLLKDASSPLIVAGQLDSRTDAEAIGTLAEALDIPLYADISSQLRMHGKHGPLQTLLLSERFKSSFAPDFVLHFGGKIVGKQLAVAIKNRAPEHFIVINSNSARYNPDHNVTLQIEASPGDFAKLLVPEKNRTGKHERSLDALSGEIEKALDDYCAPGKPLTEISTARMLSGMIPEGHGLFIANSMPIRDMDFYASLRKKGSAPLCAMNRGASGIEGNIATAAGLAEGLGTPVTLLIGDISFLHDLNSLTLLQGMAQPLHIVVINNNGGGIFSFLPVATEKDIFETNFGTPQNYRVRSAAETFGIVYSNPSSPESFKASYTDLCRSAVSGIIEVNGSREENLEEHRRVNEKLRNIIDRHL